MWSGENGCLVTYRETVMKRRLQLERPMSNALKRAEWRGRERERESEREREREKERREISCVYIQGM
jgi:hypothetical protein